MKFNKDLKLCTIQDLKIGMKFIIVKQALTPTEIKKINFYIYEIEKKGIFTDEEYIEYKQTIKQFTKNKELWVK